MKMETILELDKKILLYLNSLHVDWMDSIVLVATQTYTWIPLYIFLLYLIFRDYKKEGWIILLGIVITLVLTDRITSGLMKPYFERWRPSREPTLEGLVHLVKDFNGNLYYGGKYGFASSHAANTFGAATFFFLLFRKTRKWIVWLFLWATVMTYTRIYLGVHYPGDIIVGGIVGALCGAIGYFLSQWVKNKIDQRALDKKITSD